MREMDSAGATDLDILVSALRAGDRQAFDELSRRHFRELHVHCYRMAGSIDEADDLVQETFLRAWRGRETYEGRASVRAWLYRIATNVCLDALRARAPRGDAHSSVGVPSYSQCPWLQPYPDALLDELGDGASRPEQQLVTREAIELAFLATIQLLPAKQRAVLLLRDLVELSANDTAQALDDSLAAVNSALQRARATLDARRPSHTSASAATFDEAVLLQAIVDAHRRSDVDALVHVLREDVRMTLLPAGVTWDGRDAVACEHVRLKTESHGGQVRSVPIAANRQPALALYTRPPTSDRFQAWAITLFRVQDRGLREIATFATPDLFARFNLPLQLNDDQINEQPAMPSR
jgi:RNA polymerase sigma-70 factor, ECF subfamily